MAVIMRERDCRVNEGNLAKFGQQRTVVGVLQFRHATQIKGSGMKQMFQVILGCLVLLTSQACLSKEVNHAIPAIHTLNSSQQKTLDAWLKNHPNFRVAGIDACVCDEDIKAIRNGTSTGIPEPDYHPYLVVGDFNGDGYVDFAVVVDDIAKLEKNFVNASTLLVFNGPFSGKIKSPAFIQSDMDLGDNTLFFGPTLPNEHKPVGFALAPFNSEPTVLLIPHKNTYEWKAFEMGE